MSVRSRVLEVREKSIRFLHGMRNDETGEIEATAERTGAYLDTARRKSCPFPEEIFERGRPPIVPD